MEIKLRHKSMVACVLPLLLVGCGGDDGGNSPPPTSGTPTPTPTPTPAPTPTPTTSGRFVAPGDTFVGETVGTEVVRILIIRTDFVDERHALSNQEWIDIMKVRLAGLQAYYDQHYYEQFRVEAVISSVIERDTKDDFFNLQDARTTSRNDFRVLAPGSATDNVASLDNADHVVYSYPSIPHNQSGGAFGSRGNIWWPIESTAAGHTNGFIHEYGHSLGMPHSQAMEGAAFGVAEADYTLVNNNFVEGYDGLYMIGSDSQAPQRPPGRSPYPLVFAIEAGLIPDRFLDRIEANGAYRLYQARPASLPAGDEKMLYGIRVGDEEYFLTFDPQQSIDHADIDPTGFNTGVIVHRRPQAAQTLGRIAVIDFSPGSLRAREGYSTQSSWNYQLYRDTRDGSLQVGDSFALPGSGVVVEPLRTGSVGSLRYIDLQITGI